MAFKQNKFINYLTKVFGSHKNDVVCNISDYKQFSSLSIKSRLLDVDDDLVLKEIKKDSWETGSVHIWVWLMRNFNFDNIYDFGAYTGIYGIIASELSHPKVKVCLIEGNPFVYSRLSANLRLNGISTKRALWTLISTYEKNTLSIHLRLSPSSLTTAGSIDARDDAFTLDVPNKNVNDFIKNIKGTLLAKIDIEGNEIPLLTALINKYQEATVVILVEILTTRNFKELIKLALANEFSVFPIYEKQIAIGGLYSQNTGGMNRNYLVVSRKAEAIINALTRKGLLQQKTHPE